MRILLFGADGQVGRELRRALAPLGTLVLSTRNGRLADGSHCEAADLEWPGTLTALIDRAAPDIVVNAAADTAVDLVEDAPERAFRVNAEAPAAIAAACARCGALLVHYSTDYVFDDGSERPRRESDAPKPLNVYGASKLAGEEAVRGSGARHLLLRTSWVYAMHGRNFLLTMLRLAAEHGVVRVVDDQFGSPTPASWLADATAHVLQRPPVGSGLWHVSASGCTSWHGFADAIFELAQAHGLLGRRPELVSIATSDYPATARRPGRSCLDSSRFRADFGIDVPEWRSALAGVLERMASAATRISS
ncbi:dTDP-4-dehydrorhamnose reductase [Luteimonas suaedae]|uniref:dTDP-4-dehydrorhamnose reductase n=1 Tax=Luteimonas suaedae TaxID=2605430 RepID=UPI0011F03CCB|nr:dTDP-4-dehydrorhamnose reductase [Luteimonas suaedae]